MNLNINANAGNDLQVTNRATGKVQKFISSDGNPVSSGVAFQSDDLKNGGISLKQAGGRVVIKSLKTINIPNVVYVNYIAPDGEVIGEKRFDDSGERFNHTSFYQQMRD
jgi:hypothetical protein